MTTITPTPVSALPSLPRAKRTPKPQACACGCANPTRGGRFLPGHDAKLHAWALAVESGRVAEAPAPHTAAVAAEVARRAAAGLTGDTHHGKRGPAKGAPAPTAAEIREAKRAAKEARKAARLVRTPGAERPASQPEGDAAAA